jgi:hypothetical protein
MALFQFNNQALAYDVEFAPFSYDLVLLQSSRFSTEFWSPVIADLTHISGVHTGGRILTCDWKVADFNDEQQAEFFVKLLQTLGMHGAQVVAFDDAVKMASMAERLHPGVFSKTLFYPQGGPKAEPLEKAVREFCGI